MPSYLVVRRQGFEFRHPGSIMWFITSQIRGDGDILRWQSPESLLVNPSILTTSFQKCCCWQWPTDIRLMQVECSCRSEALLVLVSPDLEILDSYLKASCLLLIQQALTSRFNYSTLDQRSLVRSATQSIALRWLIHALPVLQRVFFSFEETHPYDIYHKGDITLVLLGSVLACFFCIEKELFFYLDLSICPYSNANFRRFLTEQTELVN